MRCRWFLDILTIAISAIIFAQTLGPIVFQWFFPISEPMFGDDFLWKTQKQRILRHAQIRDKLCVYKCSGGWKGKKITVIERKLRSRNIILQNLWLDCFFMCYHRERMMVFNVTITIGAIICAQPLELIIFRWLSIIGPAMRLYRCIVQV